MRDEISNNKIFISSNVKRNYQQSFKLAKKLNTGIEITELVNPQFFNNKFSNEIFKMSELIRLNNIDTSIHAPFFDLNPLSFDDYIKKYTNQRYNKTFEAAKTLNCKTVIFHSSYNPNIKMDFYLDYFIENQIKFWKKNIYKYEQSGIIATIENTFENDPQIIKSIINGVTSENLKFCLDTGHSNLYSEFSVTEWIKINSDCLHYMHLHNNFGKYDDHNSLLEGNIDFYQVFNKLKNLNLKPDVSLEIFNEEKAIESIKLLKLNF